MVTEKTIRTLLTGNTHPKLSIILPTRKVGPDRQQNPIRFKNLIAQATRELKSSGLKDTDIQQWLQPAKELLGQPLFWSEMEQSLVLYISNGHFELYRLPYTCDEVVYVNKHYYIQPLLPMISTNGSYGILSVSQENVRLLRCSGNSIEDITPETLTHSIDDWLGQAPEPQLQFHSVGKSGDPARFFGHGSSDEDKKELTRQFFRDVEKEVTRTMKSYNDPLVLAGLETNLSMYRKINRYQRVVDNAFQNNPDTLTDSELRDGAWDIIREHFLAGLYSALDSWKHTPDQRKSVRLSELVPSSIMGKTQTLFVRKGAAAWGTYDESHNRVLFTNNPGPGDVELMNWLSIKVMETGGQVFLLESGEMPDQADVAGLYRF